MAKMQCRSMLRFVVVLVLSLLTRSNALYEDQVGKFEWRLQQLGCLQQVKLGRSPDGDEYLVVSAASNAIARISLHTGELAWRQLNEEIPNASEPILAVTGTKVIVLTNGGEYLRVFDLETGSFLWQHKLGVSPIHGAPKIATSKEGLVAFLIGSRIVGLHAGDRLDSKWENKLDSEHIHWIGLHADDDDHIYVAGYERNTQELVLHSYGARQGERLSSTKVGMAGIDPDRCILHHALLVCPKMATTDGLLLVDVAESEPKQREWHMSGGDSLVALEAHLSVPGFFIVRTHHQLLACDTTGNNVRVVVKVEAGPSSAYTLSRNHVVTYEAATHELKLYQLSTGRLEASLRLEELAENRAAPINTIHLLEAVDGPKQLLAIREDCRVDYFDFPEKGRATAKPEWIRHEGLANISAVEVLDLPLSEAQARIESEFSLSNAPMWKCFLMRVKSQLEQLKHSLLNLATLVVHTVSSNRSISSVLSILLGRKQSHSGGRHGISEEVSTSLQRDYFNLDKMILASSLSGSLYGINSENGDVVWSIYLGSDAVPFKDQLGRGRIQLFVQRDTSLAQYSSQAVAIFKSKKSGNGIILAFNPITSAVEDRYEVPDLKRVELLPFPDQKQLKPLLLLLGGNNLGKVVTYPRQESYSPLDPLHLIEFSPDGSSISGLRVDLGRNEVKEEWKTMLSPVKILAAAGKSVGESVHSQGKVLGDRSVLYKYSNPNLIAIASLAEESSELTITLFDGVSGQIVHRAQHQHSAGPIHLVHCENWLVYSRWNERARRTELGVIELYEGLAQNNAEQFDSYTPLKHPLIVHSQSYIFAQGISAMAASNTEQGLSTRSLLVAMPFGGVLEISKRFLDARRPFEMTPEMREEMIIPYMPELPIATEDLINYNQTVRRIQGIKTASSGLESTGLVFAYGLDIFYTRVTPSGTFDKIADSFDYPLIAGVMLALVVASAVCRRIWKISSLKQAWS